LQVIKAIGVRHLGIEVACSSMTTVIQTTERNKNTAALR
jgi:hypothetical protein